MPGTADGGTERGPATSSEPVDGGAFLGFESHDRPSAPDVPPQTNLGYGDGRPPQREAQHQDAAPRASSDGAATATQFEWTGSWRSQGEDRRAHSWGNGWGSNDRHGQDNGAANWTRRTSWDDTTTTTGGMSGDAKPWDPRGVDPWTQGADPWMCWRNDSRQDRADGHGWREPDQGPQADGRAGSGHGSDPGDHRGGDIGAAGLPATMLELPGTAGRTTRTAASRATTTPGGAPPEAPTLPRNWQSRPSAVMIAKISEVPQEVTLGRSKPGGG